MEMDLTAALAEMKSAATVVTLHKDKIAALEAKLAEGENRIGDLEAHGNRPGAGAAQLGNMQIKGLSTLARTGDESEFKSMSVGSGPDGGFTVSPVLANMMNSKLFDVSPLGRLARRIQIESGSGWEEPIDFEDLEGDWGSESSARNVLESPGLKLLKIDLHEVWTLQRITQRLLDDSRFDLDTWIASKISDKFARLQGDAFTTGDGIIRPRGLLTYDLATTDDDVRDYPVIQYLPTGTSGGFDATKPADILIDTIYKLRAPYRANARWLMNSNTAGTVRKFKDGEGRFLWSDSLIVGQPSTLLGYPVEIDEGFPDIAADSLSIAFGDFAQAYTIISRPGLRLLRDPFSAKPHVLFYATQRVGGGVSNSEAVKLVKFAAT